MAVKLSALNLPFGKGKPEAKAEAKPVAKRPAKAAAQAAGKGGGAAPGPVVKVGGMAFSRRTQVLAALFAAFAAIAVALTFLELRGATQHASQISAAGQMAVLSQRISNESQQALQGNAQSFARLRDSRDRFGLLLNATITGGEVGGLQLDPASDDAVAMVQKVKAVWERTNRNAGQVINQEKNLVALGQAVRTINADNPTLLDLAEQVAALKLQTQSSSREISLAGQLVMLTQRMAKNANTLLASEVVDPEVTFLLGKDSNTFRDVLQGLTKGSDTLRIPAARDPETVEKLKELEVAYTKFRQSINAILGSLQPLVNAKRAGAQIVKDSPALLGAVSELEQRHKGMAGSNTLYLAAIAITSLLALGCLGLIAKTNLDENRRRREDSERLREDG
jgi:twitching motility protein PilJ